MDTVYNWIYLTNMFVSLYQYVFYKWVDCKLGQIHFRIKDSWTII